MTFTMVTIGSPAICVETRDFLSLPHDRFGFKHGHN